MSRTLFSAVRRGAALPLAAARNNCGGTECCSGRMASRFASKNNCDASTDCCSTGSGRRAFSTIPASQFQAIRVNKGN